MKLPGALLFVASLALVGGAAREARGQTDWAALPLWTGQRAPQSQPHPAVARITVPNRDGTSLGSGSLVYVSAQHGLVVTNWHVVHEASGMIVVDFPDGFRSGAQVLAVDRDWDLAALAIWRPHATPLAIATARPKIGDPLTIAGYGSGTYRTATGRLAKFMAPGPKFPNEILELAAGARSGDSGGPILNARGELAGVLFGAAGGFTSGSECGRVRYFLSSVMGAFEAADPQQIGPAAQPVLAELPGQRPDPVGSLAVAGTPGATRPGWPTQPAPNGGTAAGSMARFASNREPPLNSAQSQANAPLDLREFAGGAKDPGGLADRGVGFSGTETARSEVLQPLGGDADIQQLIGRTPIEQGKSVLAAVGLFAVLIQVVRLLAAPGAAPEAEQKKE